MAVKEATPEELKQLNDELSTKLQAAETKNAESAKTITELTEKLTASEKENKQLNSKIQSSDSELKVAGEVVEGLKTKLANVEAAAEESGTSKTIHKLGKQKFRLLYSVKFAGEEVTDETLSGNEKLLGELVKSGSGAVQEVL